MSLTTSSPEARSVGRLGSRKGRRRLSPWLIIPVGLAIAAGGYVAYQLSGAGSAATTAVSTATVSRGTLSASVAGSGTVAAGSSRALSFAVDGTVAAVLVEVGDTVAAGQALAQIDADALQLALQQAEANLTSAEAQLAAANGQGATAEELAAAESQLRSAQAQFTQTVTGDVTAADLSSAQAQLSSAQAQLADLLDGPTTAERAAAEAAVTQAALSLESQRSSLASAKVRAESDVATAANSLRDAQDSFSTLYWQNRQLEKAPGDLPQSAQDEEAATERAVANAEESYRQAQVAYEQAKQAEIIGIQQAETELTSAQRDLATLVDGATAAELSSARASVASAQASLDNLRQGATDAERTIAQASVDQAQINLAQLTSPGSAVTIASAEATMAQAQVAVTAARLDLDEATLAAPFAGVVSEVLITAGDSAAAGGTITVLDPDDLYVELSLSESDVAAVAVGQPVELVFDALPDATITGAVSVVAPAATVSSNVATYPVRVSFDPGDQPVRVGMTASGTIMTEERADALIVPTRAVQTRGDTELVLVQQADGQQVVPVRVETGLSSDGQTEILGCVDTGSLCLQEGDTLLVSAATSDASETQTGGALGGFGGPGLGGPPPGMGR